MLKPTIIAIPIFALLIAVETFLAVRYEEKYDRKDIWTNIALGFGSVGFGFIFAIIQVFFYEAIYQNIAPFQMPMTTFGGRGRFCFSRTIFFITGFTASVTKSGFSGIFTSSIIRRINTICRLPFVKAGFPASRTGFFICRSRLSVFRSGRLRRCTVLI